jgi:hypothetical protein
MDARGISGNWNLADTESSQASLASSTTLELDGDLIADIALGVPNRDRTGDAVQSSEANEILRKLETIRPFDEVPQAGADGVTNTGGSGPVAISTDRPTRPFRISTWSRSLLQSGIPNTAPIAVHDLNRDPWAADVLAVSGLLLIAASVLYVASDALLWF